MKPYILKDMAIELSVPMNVNNDGKTIDCRDFKNLFITAQWAGCNSLDSGFIITTLLAE